MIWAGSIVGMEISTRQENSDPNNVSGFLQNILNHMIDPFLFFFVCHEKQRVFFDRELSSCNSKSWILLHDDSCTMQSWQ